LPDQAVKDNTNEEEHKATYKVTKSDRLAQSEADKYLANTDLDRRKRVAPSRYSPEPGKAKGILNILKKTTDNPLVSKIKANPPVKQPSPFRREPIQEDKRLIKPKALGILPPIGATPPYRPLRYSDPETPEHLRVLTRNITPIEEFRQTGSREPETLLNQRFDLPAYRLDFDAEIEEEFPENLFVEQIDEINENIANDDIEQLLIREEILEEPELPELELEVQIENIEQLEDIDQQNIENNMAAPVNLAGVIQHLQGENEEQKNAAMVQLAQFVQNINQPPAPVAVPAPSH